MEDASTINSYLMKKFGLLSKLAANTETQCRFVHKREMKGLGRILTERDVLMENLAVLERTQQASDSKWQTMPEFEPMLQSIADKEAAILVRSRQVLEAAKLERGRIAAELKSRKAQRQINNQYVNHWMVMVPGAHINKKR